MEFTSVTQKFGSACRLGEQKGEFKRILCILYYLVSGEAPAEPPGDCKAMPRMLSVSFLQIVRPYCLRVSLGCKVWYMSRKGWKATMREEVTNLEMGVHDVLGVVTPSLRALLSRGCLHLQGLDGGIRALSSSLNTPLALFSELDIS